MSVDGQCMLLNGGGTVDLSGYYLVPRAEGFMYYSHPLSLPLIMLSGVFIGLALSRMWQLFRMKKQKGVDG